MQGKPTDAPRGQNARPSQQNGAPSDQAAGLIQDIHVPQDASDAPNLLMTI
ncbi:hypothetical protein Lalb_Chr10g0104641 [Lupinus albus]|uniref:Uncharacterized protein n=1 Tax=Lupinus albus TaxID=3870 RepID=A0A6A4PX34_LUPAL|nr:hypothetical protein Lalb_Chr10g0104641 [Lupinus albus]